jgi:drug/metabolite transporter (DMT)-like permease
MSFTSSRAGALLALVAGAAAIAFSPIFVRLTETGPAAAGFWRLALALPALALMARQSRSASGGVGGPHLMTIVAGLFFALDLGFWHYGIKFTTVANSTILANLSPAFVTLGAWLLLGERPGWRFVAGLALAFAGVWIIAATKGGGAGLNPRLGDALSVITSVWYAGYLLAVRKARAEQSTSQVMFWSSAAGAPLILAAAVALHERILPTSAGGWMACAGLAVVHVAGQGLIAWALGRLPAATASVVVLVQPVLSAILGWLIFTEPMAPLQVLGGAVALTGVVLAQLAAARAPAPDPAAVRVAGS